jgi:hypothetical protein
MEKFLRCFAILLVLWGIPCSSGAGGKDARPMVFHRVAEPRESAFTVLVPQGWKTEGGIFHVDPLAANGPGNSLEPKCDFTVKMDDRGSVHVRWLPGYNYADMSGNPRFAYGAAFFPPGSSYQGMVVRPMPDALSFLRDLFRSLHPGASSVAEVEGKPIPELAEIFRRINGPVNDMLVRLGFPAMGFDAAGLVVDYTEGNGRFRQALVTVIQDSRGSAAMWSNLCTIAMGAPVEESDRWKPVLEIIRQSFAFNPRWVARAAQAAGERAAIVRETMEHIQKVDQEIWDNRRKTQDRIAEDSYLALTGQEDYVNPYTGETERDSSAYRYRWTTAGGDRIYTDEEGFDPNGNPGLSGVEWKKTPVRER